MTRRVFQLVLYVVLLVTIDSRGYTLIQKTVYASTSQIPDILQQAKDYGCDTYLTGTIEHRWGLPHFQESNKKFNELNKQLKMNLIGGTHFGTERPAMMKVVEYFKDIGMDAEYCEDKKLLYVL